jgi:RNA polymerase sigma factor (sigma-70 family)
MAQLRDRRLVARMRDGDESAFEAVYARHHPSLLAFCRHLTGSREDAEDAVQHAFLAAYRQLADSDEKVELRPWLYTVARNRCLSLLRARRERPVAVRADAAHSLEGLSAEVERRQELRDLVRDLARLPEPQRAALVLSQLDALSYREIGVVLEVEPAKVKALVFQARSSLASAREARDTPCLDIRHEIATAHGAGLRRRLLRRHVGQCDGCREFEVAVRRQRSNLGSLLPVAPSAGLASGVLGGHGRDGAAAAAAAGGSATVGAGGGMLAALGVPGLAKLAVVATVAGGGVGGAVAAEVPQRIAGGEPSPELPVGSSGGSAGPGDGAVDVPDGAQAPSRSGTTPSDADRADVLENAEDKGPRMVAGTGVQPGEPAAPPEEEGESEPQDGDPGPGAAPDPDLPPGLAKRDELPPGLAKRDDLPPGLAKRGDPAANTHAPSTAAPPGNSGDKGGNGHGNGNGGTPPAGAGGQGGGPPSSPPGHGNGGGSSNGSGGGGGNANGQPATGGQQGGGPGNGKSKGKGGSG